MAWPTKAHHARQAHRARLHIPVRSICPDTVRRTRPDRCPRVREGSLVKRRPGRSGRSPGVSNAARGHRLACASISSRNPGQEPVLRTARRVPGVDVDRIHLRIDCAGRGNQGFRVFPVLAGTDDRRLCDGRQAGSPARRAGRQPPLLPLIVSTDGTARLLHNEKIRDWPASPLPASGKNQCPWRNRIGLAFES